MKSTNEKKKGPRKLSDPRTWFRKKEKEARWQQVNPGERDENGKLKTPHTVYGLGSNLVYIIRKMWQYRKSLIFCIIVGAISQSVMRYLWSYISKYVIDIVQIQATYPEKDLTPLLHVLAVTTIVEIICISSDTVIWSHTWRSCIYTRFQLITERIEKVLSMDYETLEQPQMLDMFQRANQATDGNNNGVEGMMRQMYKMGVLIFTMLVSGAAIIMLDWRLLLALALNMGLNYLSFLWSIRDDKIHFWDKMSPVWRKMNYMERCTQDFDFAKDIRLFSMKNWLLGKQKEVLDDHIKKAMKSRDFWLRHSFIYSFTGIFGSGVMYYILGSQAYHQQISIGDLALFLGLCGAFSSALSDFYVGVGNLQRASMQTDDFRTFMDYPADEVGEFEDLNKVAGEGTLHFEFKNVSFKYEGAQDYALKNLNLTFPAGQRLAVVGLNGAGKTTFIKLLLRLYDVTEGEILLNGVNIKRFRKVDYYKLFAPVFQNVELFAFPMSENISMQSPEKTDRDRARECAIKAGLADKLESFKQGIDTQLLKVVYDDGVDLSGGERQKLALARALYKDSPVIVLDEPTAALDALAEYELYQNFNSMIGDKSAVYISHRLSSTRFCDVIAMFVAGEMVEYGTHEELLRKGGAYAEMFEVQAQYYEVQDGEE